jgi:hypothetical protein
VHEKLLQFIWQYSLYRPSGLLTDEGEPITVIHPGKLNTHAGPDFLEAKVKIGDTTLVGHIELHVHTSDWLKHGHQHDKAYHNIILHVVYSNDVERVMPNIPVVDISTHITAAVIERYNSLLGSKRTILCAPQLDTVRDITKHAWLTRLLAERWEEKLVDWKELLKQSVEDWHDLLYWRMAYNFGFKVNSAQFLALAQSIPLNVLAKHRENLLQVEALLFGQAGMLNADFKDAYPQQLKTEYDYLSRKYKLTPVPQHLWKFLRMRPANFPTIRIAQFAALVHESLHLFSQIIEVNSVKEIMPLLEVQASSYWDNHYRFDDEAGAKTSVKKLGKSSVHNIIINTIPPIQFLYASRQGVSGLQEKALQLLDEVPAEKNHIIDEWEAAGWKVQNAAQSQALLQLYNNYCSLKRCLECSLGHSIMRSGPKE